MGMGESAGRVEQEAYRADQLATLPAWTRKLARRIAKLEDGHVYNIVLVVSGERTVWSVRPEGKAENER